MNRTEQLAPKKIDIRGIIIRILIFFIALTGLNILVFSIMAFANYSRMISKYAITSVQAKGMEVRRDIEKRLHYEDMFTEENVELFISRIRERFLVTEDDLDFLWNELSEKTIDEEDLSFFREILLKPKYNITQFVVFDVTGKALYQFNYPEDKSEASNIEKKRIIQSILAYDKEGKAFYNEEIRDYQFIDIYVPIYYGENTLIFKLTISEPEIKDGLQRFFLQAGIAGGVMIIGHLLFMLITYNILVKPMRRTNQVLEEQNDQLNEQNHILENQKRMLEEELEIAEKLQQAILLRDRPDVENIEIGHIYIGMNRVSGDYIDTIPLGEDKMGLLIVDVSGHGVPSALITTMAKSLFNAHSSPDKTTAEICAAVNMDLSKSISESDYYLTAFYAIFDLKTNELEYTSAGHPKQVICRQETRKHEEISTEGFFIGSFEFAQYFSKKTSLAAGDKLLLFTDGVIEAVNEKDDIYDYPALYDFIEENFDLSASDFSNKLLEDVRKFQGDADETDDISLLVLEVK